MILDPGSHPAWAYWPHVVFGVLSVAMALIAILAAKGSRIHRRSGQVFAWSMGIAAVTAMIFVGVTGFGAPHISAMSVLYALLAGVLTLRERRGALRALQWGIIIIPVGLVLLNIPGFFQLLNAPFGLLTALFLPALIAMSILFAWLAWGDLRFLRTPDPDRLRRFRRHAVRMALAAAETVRAPLISFAPRPEAAQEWIFFAYFFGPFLLVPLVYYLAMPAWVKAGEEARAAKLSTATV